MKTNNSKIYAWVFVTILAMAIFILPPRTPAATEDEIEASIVKGLTWLASQQASDGSWPYGCESVAVTGMAVFKFELRAIELGYDPFDPEYEYSDEVQKGLAYIISKRGEQAIGIQPAGNPDGNGNGKGVWFNTCPGSSHVTYNTGIAMMALAASGHPELYQIDLQDAVDYMAWAQADVGCGVHRGGWRYVPGCDSDNSNSGWATLGLGFAAAQPPYGFGVTIPQWVKDELSIWINVMQDDVNSDPDDGGSWYAPDWAWVNILKTGNLLYEMAIVGDTTATQRVQDAIDYIERHWNDAGGCGTGWVNHRQAMFTMMKGLEVFGVKELDIGVGPFDWFGQVSTHLVSTQNVDGSWPVDCWAGQVLSTAWALLTLERFVPQIGIKVGIDVKPGSCPNPLNLASKGDLPVAILGTENFDVTQIDPSTIKLAGVSPIRINGTYDVSRPFVGELIDCNSCVYGYNIADGYNDLLLKFDTQEIVAALGEVSDQDCVVLHLTGNLLEEYGGTPIFGDDIIRILKKK